MNEEQKDISNKHQKNWRTFSWVGLVTGLLFGAGVIIYYLMTDFTYWSAGTLVPLALLSFVCVPVLILSAAGFIRTSKKYRNRTILPPNLERRREHSWVGIGISAMLITGGIIYFIDAQIRGCKDFSCMTSVGMSFVLFLIGVPIFLLSTIGFMTTRKHNSRRLPNSYRYQ